MFWCVFRTDNAVCADTVIYKYERFINEHDNISSIYGGKKILKKGWFFGIVLGLVFTLLLVPLGMCFGQSLSLDKYFAAKMLMGGSVGLIGGIIGINLN